MTMVQRVASAMCLAQGIAPDDEVNGSPRWRRYAHLARAAIEAMREPTKRMSDAGWAYVEKKEDAFASSTPHGLYSAMIDAALSEES